MVGKLGPKFILFSFDPRERTLDTNNNNEEYLNGLTDLLSWKDLGKKEIVALALNSK